MKKKFFLIIFVLFFPLKLFALDDFIIRKIIIRGAHRVAKKTVQEYLPVQIGDLFDKKKSSEIITKLYATGFFENVVLIKQNDTLIVTVDERPTIGKLDISGNSAIPTDRLKKVLRSLNVIQGRIYNNVVLAKIRQSLLSQYYALGRYNATVDVNLSPMGQNRVRVEVKISEGLVAKVEQINIIGNKHFTKHELLKHLDLKSKNLFSMLLRTDRFSSEKLQLSLQHLTNFYMDKGYLRFQIKSSQISITPNHKSIFINIILDEGKLYKIESLDFVGDLPCSKKTLLEKIDIKSGELFSRKKLIQAHKIITDAFGDVGYIYADVKPVPVINEKNSTVIIKFYINKGKRIYVRRISFTDNIHTNDIVLRRELSQLESSPVSFKALDQSKLKLNRLDFINTVNMSMQKVAGKDDQVDIIYHLKESAAAQANFSVTYGEVGGVGFGVGLNQKNFLGTGDTLGINLSRNRYQQSYSLDFSDPYYTPTGVSKSFGFSIVKFNPQGANLTSGYSEDQYSFYIGYGIPIGQEQNATNRLQFSYGVEETNIRLSSRANAVSQQIINFVQRYGRRFRQFNINSIYTRDSRDRSIFPTTGGLQRAGVNIYAPLNAKSLKYFILSYQVKWYVPLSKQFIFTMHSQLGYGTTFNQGANGFPFFKNFYAGGIGSVRGFDGNTLGPKDSKNSAIANPTGGNKLFVAGVGLIFPNPYPEKLRTELFLDGGNVYNTWNNRKYGGAPSGSLRYSVGINVAWLSPLGAEINFALAKPLNAKPGDSINTFDFQLGASFG